MLIFVGEQDIFTYQDVEGICLVNPVNCLGVMGKGLALEFKRRFPGNFTAYAEHCTKGSLNPGDIFWTHDADKEVVIANLATKKDWREQSRMEYIETGLTNLSIWEGPIALPKIGCGLGALKWADVKDQISRSPLRTHKWKVFVLGD